MSALACRVRLLTVFTAFTAYPTGVLVSMKENNTFYEITLEDESVLLDEVVAIGYGTQSKATVTSGVVSVKKAELMSSVSASPLNNLQGKVAGLDIRQTTGQPGAQPVVLIRGGSTDPANDSPLFVIDGVVRSNMNGLNQEDIESMEVLKDAASAAIYGAKAANGIILLLPSKALQKMVKPLFLLPTVWELSRFGSIIRFPVHATICMLPV